MVFRKSVYMSSIPDGVIEELLERRESTIDFPRERTLGHEGLEELETEAREDMETSSTYRYKKELLDQRSQEETLISEDVILKLHELHAEKEGNTPGKYRKDNVSFGRADLYAMRTIRFEGFKDEEVPSAIKKLVQWFQSPATRKIDLFVRISVLIEGLISIHPFVDGNGRVARDLIDLLLVFNGYKPIKIDGGEKKEFVAAMDFAHPLTCNNPYPLAEFIRTRAIARTYQSKRKLQ